MKEIMYKSTRSDSAPVTASRAILMGLAEDGGLFVPTEFPVLDKSLSELAKMDYQGVAYEVMKLLLSDFTEKEENVILCRSSEILTAEKKILAFIKGQGTGE